MKNILLVFILILFIPSFSFAYDLSELEEMSNLGNKKAQHNLGLVYLKGQGVKKNCKKAVYWWKKSAEQGDAKSQNGLGVLYGNGQCVKKDYKKSIYWHAKSAKQGFVQSQLILGLMYGAGYGVGKDYKVAYMWLYVSLINNNTKATKYLSHIEKKISLGDRIKAKEKAKVCINSNYRNCNS